jgi:hypothetical protein
VGEQKAEADDRADGHESGEDFLHFSGVRRALPGQPPSDRQSPEDRPRDVA